MTEKWYQDGLRFKCTECGNCCTGAPGYVWVTFEEMELMAQFLELTLQDFMRLYVRRVGQRYSLLESKKTFDCVFLKDKKCQIYRARPTQCRTFPWWKSQLTSKEAWQEAAKSCEGINDEAPLVPYATIKENLDHGKINGSSD